MENKSLAQVRELFQDDRFATLNGAQITEIGDHFAKCELELEKRHRNALGAVMGGATFTLWHPTGKSQAPCPSAAISPIWEA